MQMGRGGGALSARARPQAGLCRGAQQPRHRPAGARTTERRADPLSARACARSKYCRGPLQHRQSAAGARPARPSAAHFERGLAINPNDPKARNSFGLALAAGGKFDKAAGQFERALALAPGFIDAYNNLAKAFLELTRLDAALGVLRRAIDVGPTLETKSLFIQCLRSLDPIPDTDDLRRLLVRAFSETWARAQDLGPIAAGFVKRDPAIRDCIARTTQAWPQRLPAQELLGPAGFAAISDCRLLISLIESTPVCDLALERLLTGVRHALLETASADAPSASVDDNVDDKILRLSYALARQCFLNEYIFDHTGEEFARARHLRDLLERASAAGTVIPDLWLALVAAYFPLHSVRWAAACRPSVAPRRSKSCCSSRCGSPSRNGNCDQRSRR